MSYCCAAMTSQVIVHEERIKSIRVQETFKDLSLHESQMPQAEPHQMNDERYLHTNHNWQFHHIHVPPPSPAHSMTSWLLGTSSLIIHSAGSPSACNYYDVDYYFQII